MTPRKTRILTGITTSGTPHLGNYVGAIRPAVAASKAPDVESFYFLADLHALIKVQDPARVQRSTLEIAATWLACGLDPGQVWFYRQSDGPETTELTWLLTGVAGKGVLNRAHAYKAAVDRNRADGEDDDAGINAGLFMYPVLMSADILLFNADRVPVGRDQVQHIEMARDFGQRFNHLYGEHFRLPEAAIEENVATLPGLDGRKMSKSYDNTNPLFAPRATRRKLIASNVTDSRAPGEALQPTGRVKLPGARGGKRREGGHAARTRRPQEFEELRQRDPAVRAGCDAAQADRVDRHRLARAGGGEGRGQLQRVPALPGIRQCGRNGGDAARVRAGHRLGRCQAAPVRAHRFGSRAAARALRDADGRAAEDRAPAARRRPAPA